MFKAEVIQVIRTDLDLRGAGTEDDPKRRVVQYWTLDGTLLWEFDPHQQAAPDYLKLAGSR
jgi:hypothetical protein